MRFYVATFSKNEPGTDEENGSSQQIIQGLKYHKRNKISSTVSGDMTTPRPPPRRKYSRRTAPKPHNDSEEKIDQIYSYRDQILQNMINSHGNHDMNHYDNSPQYGFKSRDNSSELYRSYHGIEIEGNETQQIHYPSDELDDMNIMDGITTQLNHPGELSITHQKNESHPSGIGLFAFFLIFSFRF